MTLPVDQGRARGLYDEQLQRLQQEKMLGAGADRPFLLAGGDPASAAQKKTGAD